jgi:hypothetical protein
METKTCVSIRYLSILFATTNPIKISICDCMKPVTRGLLDLSDNEYCFQMYCDKDDVQRAMGKPIKYKVITTMDAVLKMEGLVCSQWIETKKV